MKNKLFRRFLIIIISYVLFFTTINTVFADGNKTYYLGGFPLGFDLSAEGALVVGISEVICEDDVYLPAGEAGIKVGDYLISLDGTKITCAKDIDKVLSAFKGEFLVAEVISQGEKRILNIYPKKDLSGTYKLGLLIQDYLSGLGTVTLIDENGNFCSLGHPIADDNGRMLNIASGISYNCSIKGVLKGTRGKAGELQGSIIREEILGTVTKNTQIGLIGKLNNTKLYDKLQKIQIGEPCLGNAEIYTTISGSKPSKYSISIVKIDSRDKDNKNMTIKITDDKLIRYAGGIVQGMSGSPIVQNGKIIGAVTHVFLNDSTRGYAISINKMIEYLQA